MRIDNADALIDGRYKGNRNPAPVGGYSNAARVRRKRAGETPFGPTQGKPALRKSHFLRRTVASSWPRARRTEISSPTAT